MLKFLKNRSRWFALHEFDELRQLKNVRFEVVHHTPAFQNLVALYKKDRLTGEEFLIRCEEVRKAEAAPHADGRKRDGAGRDQAP